jgi:hypothetical protein
MLFVTDGRPCVLKSFKVRHKVLAARLYVTYSTVYSFVAAVKSEGEGGPSPPLSVLQVICELQGGHTDACRVKKQTLLTEHSSCPT